MNRGTKLILVASFSIVLACGWPHFLLCTFASIAQPFVIKEIQKTIGFVFGSFIGPGWQFGMHFVGMLAFNMGHLFLYAHCCTSPFL